MLGARARTRNGGWRLIVGRFEFPELAEERTGRFGGSKFQSGRSLLDDDALQFGVRPGRRSARYDIPDVGVCRSKM
jgi:hypothetical protein